MPSRAPRLVTPLVVLALALGATGAATWYVAETVRAQDRVHFDATARRTTEAIEQRLVAYVTSLRGGAALFSAVPDPGPDAFHAFVARLETQERHPGLQGIGFSRRIPAAERQAVVAGIRARGLRDFHVWPDEPRAEYHAIVYLEPLDRRNRAAIGYDMFTEPTRRAAMERARDEGVAAASGKVTLIQEIDERKQPGFLIYVPVYGGGIVPRTLDERRASLVGFVYSPFRVGDLLRGIFGADREAGVAFTVYDGAEPTAAHLLHRGATLPRAYLPRFTTHRRLDVAGRPWTLVFATLPAFERSSVRGFVPLVGLVGMVLSGLLFALMRAEATARVAAEQHAAELRDAEARLRAETSAARHARATAEEASRLKDEFLATVSHELRTPLAAILGWTQALRRGRFEGDRLARGLEAVERNARALTQLVSDLLDVSRIVSGKMRLDVQRVALQPVVESAIETVRPAADAKEIAIETHFADGVAVAGDAGRLQQIVWNLLSNAVKFTPRGGRIRVELRAAAHQAEMVVRDSGVGIDPDFLPHVFERFRQVDSSTTRQHGGLGLGLAIVRTLTELHGGTVRVASAGPDTGACFTIQLPLASPRVAAQRTQPPPPTLPNLEGLHILLVEDEPDARQLIAMLLRERDAHVTAVPTVQAALEEFERRRPDVVISDIAMPGDDGYELMRRLRARPQDSGGGVPAIALTALAREEDRRNALSAGYQRHLAKPIEQDDLISVVASVAGRA